uniref:Uncharacterized protein n=1 Tax=viral metagenome TaxID=1070528 RepID=A0A6C0JDG1_9ZZZZ
MCWRNLIFFNLSLFSIASIYFTYLYINDDIYNNTYHNTGSLLEKCFFVTAFVVNSLVHDYFYTFRYCWTVILIIFDSMITNYVIFLGFMVDRMLVYPTSLILGITSSVLLWIVRLIIKDIFSNK